MTGGTLCSCLIAGNRITDGHEGSERKTTAGIYRTGGTVENCTIVNNIAGSGCGGYYSENSDAGKCVNTIIYGNINGVATDSHNGTSGVEGADNNLSTSATNTLSSCYADDPIFMMKGEHPYDLNRSSPCVNSAVELPRMVDTFDIKGAKRIFNKRPDIGCYERSISPATVIILQ